MKPNQIQPFSLVLADPPWHQLPDDEKTNAILAEIEAARVSYANLRRWVEEWLTNG